MKNGRTNKLKQRASDINTDLLRYYTIMPEVFKKYEVKEIMPTPQEIKDSFDSKVNPTEEPQEIQKGFWEIFNEFVSECGKQLSFLKWFMVIRWAFKKGYHQNDCLKELGELAEINKSIQWDYYSGNQCIDKVTPRYTLLGTHAGRRTFICNALALGIPAQMVMKWTGHSDYKVMKPYIDIADNIKANAMNKFN